MAPTLGGVASAESGAPANNADDAVEQHLRDELRKASTVAGRDAAHLALLCRTGAPPAQLAAAARAVTTSAGRVAGFAHLLSR
jgi:hypothetical protein